MKNCLRYWVPIGVLSAVALLTQCTNRTGSQDTVNQSERVTSDEKRTPPPTAEMNQPQGVGESATRPAEMGTGGAGTYQSSPGTLDTYPSGSSQNPDSMQSPGSIAGADDKDTGTGGSGKKKSGKGQADAGTGGSGYDDLPKSTSSPTPRTP
jgi:hypothetical protein